MIPQKWKHFGDMFPCEKIGKNVHSWGKMETFCIARDTFLMCQVGIGKYKCMGDIQGVPKVIVQRFGLIARPVII